MKRIYLVVSLVCVMALGAFLFLRQPPSNPPVSLKTNLSEPVEDGASLMERQNAERNRKNMHLVTNFPPEVLRMMDEENKKMDKMTGVTPGMTPAQVKQKVLEWYVSQASKSAARYRRPVAFYGEILDQNNEPVSAVKVDLILGESPASSDGIVETHLQSDAQGYFSYTNAVGHVLQVWLEKNGYYVPKTTQHDFDYTSYQSNPLKPEILYVRKKGEGVDLISSRYGVYSTFDFNLPKDGASVKVDFFNRKAGSDGQMEVSGIRPPKTDYRGPKEWSLHMSIPDGGFVEQNDEFPFQAPDSGYQPTIDFDFMPGQTNWTDILDKHYYIKFGNPPKYGRIEVQTGMYRGISLDYAINPGGSANLEPQ